MIRVNVMTLSVANIENSSASRLTTANPGDGHDDRRPVSADF
jgi:hypothetical protein